MTSPNVWFMSDPHFGHRNMTEKFVMADGRRVRHEFQTMEECDEAIIQRCNERIKPGDKVYCLGDFAFSPQGVYKYRQRLVGNWNIIVGNHDPDEPDAWDFRMPDGQRAFHRVVSWRMFGPNKGPPLFVACHYPLHPMCIARHHDQQRQLICVHGHEHRTTVKLLEIDGQTVKVHDDKRYFNICVENTGYAPLHYDEIATEIKRRGF